MKRTLGAAALAAALAACGGGGGTSAQPLSGVYVPPAAPAPVSSAGPTVSLLGAPLGMPGLNRERQLRIYLPPSYAGSSRSYPVIYMHDGQNLFDNATSSWSGVEWRVDETMDALARETGLEAIVVGIDHGGELRTQEMSAWAPNLPGAVLEGPAYMDFIVRVVKPLVDSRYRTLPDRANTAIMGSSMGGLISHYALVAYPEVFGMAGLFSPSYWYTPDAMPYLGAHPARADARLYFVVGDAEGGTMVDGATAAHALALGQGAQAALRIGPGSHNETFWGAEFRRAVLWLFGRNG